MMTSDSESNTAKTINNALHRVKCAQEDLTAIQETDLGIKSKRLAWNTNYKLERTSKNLEGIKRLLLKLKNEDYGDDDSSVELDSFFRDNVLTCNLTKDTPLYFPDTDEESEEEMKTKAKKDKKSKTHRHVGVQCKERVKNPKKDQKKK